MSPAAQLKRKEDTGRNFVKPDYNQRKDNSVERTIMIVTIDHDVRTGLAEVFDRLNVKTVWLKSLESAKDAFARQDIAACLCGFWLQDGTYRQLVRYIRRHHAEVPVIIMPPPASFSVYADLLTAVKTEALDFLLYPYNKSDLKRMLQISIPDENLEKESAVSCDLPGKEAA